MGLCEIMVKIPETIIKDLRRGLSLEETLIKHNTSLKKLFSGKGADTPLSHELLYIHPTKFNTFRIGKIIDGKKIEFGTYATLEDAIIMRDALLEHNWDKSKLMDIKEYYNIKDSQGD